MQKYFQKSNGPKSMWRIVSNNGQRKKVWERILQKKILKIQLKLKRLYTRQTVCAHAFVYMKAGNAIETMRKRRKWIYEEKKMKENDSFSRVT